MDTQTFGAFLLWLIVAAVVVVIAVYILRWLYRRSTKETAFVRTGFMGEKVVVNGGAFVIPVLHEITPVNMNVVRIEVRREDALALITRNRMRVDLIAEFFVRVGASRELVAAAAQTLGRRTLQPESLRELLEGKFAGALRTVAAQMTLEEMHELRGDYAAKVRSLASESLAANGLDLESVAIVDLDQTSLEYFDPSNAFDAEGLTQLTESIETRRRMRNEIEQRTLVDIRNQNLDTQRKVLEIDRDAEYARLEQEREVEIRRAAQRSELAIDRALRDQESEQAQLSSREAVEKSRLNQERNITEERIKSEEDTQRREIARRRSLDETEMKMRELTEREQIALELSLEKARIEREGAQSKLEIERKKVLEIAELERQITLAEKALEVTRAEAEKRRAEIIENQATETARIAQDRAVDEVRIERERHLEALQIAKRQAFEEAEISASEEVERARITTERGIEEARLIKDRDIRQLGVDRDQKIEIAEIQKAIDIAKKTQERSSAIAASEAVRAKAVQAEEQAFTAREREIAERRKLTDLIGAQREAEREALRITAAADAEMKAAKSLAEAQKIAAVAAAESEKIHALAAAQRYEVDAAGHRQLNEAENLLSSEARAGRLRGKLLDHMEGIIRESVKPMEKIDGIKILHVDGINGGTGGNRNVTDEVIDSALRYRVQAPMIDNLMKEIGIEGGSLGRMTDVLRDAKDISSLTRDKKGKGKTAEDDDDDRDH
ncbi:SPFH domain-containing protein [Mesorhizobium sp. YC-39]|uniref:flotillin family protein n=1 Tax=unclassified Mesorhizobium TaxID=325217 RepID=UPI0021E8E55E|nr:MULTISPECIES: flotillin family protein [unclassified Mesorhizobium]MCV3205564.1 SPFH domain-containing protein [Mesorhizobium sp. YC-2]MCV3228037.1 SPFH domain-containing protein [Mesorhizobium sp. YC-39]